LPPREPREPRAAAWPAIFCCISAAPLCRRVGRSYLLGTCGQPQAGGARCTAFTVGARAPGRDHVQNRIREQGALVWRLLAADGYVYVCGSQPVHEAVRAAFVDVAAEHGPLPPERAEAFLDRLETTTRYRPDLWD
jgi:hypothetical protein